MALAGVSDARFPSCRNSNLGPFAFGGALYVFAITGFSVHAEDPDGDDAYLAVLKSIDGGATWEYIEGDLGPQMDVHDNFGFFNYGTNHDTRSFAVCPHATDAGKYLIAFRSLGVDPGSFGPISVSEFDLNTESWGALNAGPVPDMGAGLIPNPLEPGDDGYMGNQAHISVGISATSGIIYVIAIMAYDQSTPTSDPPNVGSRCYYMTLTGGVDGGAWSAPVRVPNQIEDPAIGGNTPGSYYPLSIVPGEAGRLHAFMALNVDADVLDADEPPGIAHWLLDDGAGAQAANCTQITGFDVMWQAYQYTDSVPSSVGFQVGTFVVGGVTGFVFVYSTQAVDDLNIFLAYAPDESALVWTTAVAVATISRFEGWSWGCGQDADDTVVFRYATGLFATLNTIKERTFDANTLTLGAETDLEDGGATGNFWFHQPTVSRTASVSTVFATTFTRPVTTVTPALPMMFMIVGLIPPPPDSPQARTFPPYGTRLLIRCPNYYDFCLHHERTGLAKIGMLRLLFPDARRYKANDPYTVIPTQGVEFKKQGAILLPAVEEVNTLVMSFRVPTGYDGSAWGILAMYTGSGYQEGSNDIIYRFAFNRRFVKNLGDIHNTMGGLAQYFPIEEHERLYSQQTIYMYVFMGPGALSRLDPTRRIIMGMEGWLYPRGGEICNPYKKRL